jgi:hypothetical protein
MNQIFLLVVLLLGALTGTLVSAAERPNVLIIICDDLNTRLGPYAWHQNANPRSLRQ